MQGEGKEGGGGSTKLSVQTPRCLNFHLLKKLSSYCAHDHVLFNPVAMIIMRANSKCESCFKNVI